ncbi:hypothetical protein [Streptomyces sp. NPDC093568]|uniref:hypothetical protein n=1 Tax=Streptomyces sp. NPDC093568 TaxID=3366041 RepID=UPI0037F59C7F
MAVLMTLVRRRKSPAGAPCDGEILRQLDDSAQRARYWVKRTPRETAHLLRRARLYSIAAASLSVLTGLWAWPVIADTSRLTAQIVLSTLSCLAALAIAAPYATGLHDRIEESIRLSATYGTLYGELLRAHHQFPTHATTPARATELIQQLNDITTHHDAPRPAASAPHSDETSGAHTPSAP